MFESMHIYLSPFMCMCVCVYLCNIRLGETSEVINSIPLTLDMITL